VERAFPRPRDEAVASRAHPDAETLFRQGSTGEVCLFTHSRAQLNAARPDRQPCSPRPRRCLSDREPTNPTAAIVRFLFVSIRRLSRRRLGVGGSIRGCCCYLRKSASICGWLAFEPTFSPFAQVFPALRLDKLARSNRSRDFHAPKTWVTGARLFHVEQH
jgi:hypothetical protein